MGEINLTGEAHLIGKEKKENEMEKRIDKIAFKFAIVIFSFISSIIVAGFFCLGYNRLIETFGFLQLLATNTQIPFKLSYLSSLSFCWVITSFKFLFVKGEWIE